MTKDTNLNGALTGLALAAATHWARYDEGTQRRLRDIRMDAEEALDLVRELQSHADSMRSRLPTVMDAQVGLSIASPQPAAAAVVPSTAPLSRPDLASQMEVAVADMKWPPEPGVYDDRGLVREAGELTSMFLALTYEEIRAFVQGLAQSRPPSREAKLQIFYAANALVAQLGEQRLSWAQHKERWARFFGNSTQPNGPAAPVAEPPRAHQDPARPPQLVGPLGPAVASLAALSSQTVAGYPYANRNTDEAMRFRITVGGNAVAANTVLGAIQFGSEYRYRAPDGSLVPFQPVVLVSPGRGGIFADSISPRGFQLVSMTGLAANQAVDVFIATVPGHAVDG